MVLRYVILADLREAPLLDFGGPLILLSQWTVVRQPTRDDLALMSSVRDIDRYDIRD